MKYTDLEYREAHENVINVVSRAKDLVMQSAKHSRLLELVNQWFNRGCGPEYTLAGDSLIKFYQSIKKEVQKIDGDYEPVQ